MTIKPAFAALATLVVAACGSSGPDGPERNQPPTISAIPDTAVMANQPSPAIGFTVSDEQPNALTLAVISDNPQVVPEDGLVLAGSGTLRQLIATPVADTVGDSFITITATDAEGLTAGSTFLLTIDPEQQSLQQFTRTAFSEGPDGEPDLVNAIAFDQDAGNDDFADLLAQ